MSTSYHFDHLPSNVLTLSGYDIFQFIRTTLGESEANFLNKILVKTTSSFILIENLLDIFNQDIDDEELINDAKVFGKMLSCIAWSFQ